MSDVLLFCVQSHRKYFAVTANIWVLACTLTMGGLLASADSACAREPDSEMRACLKEASEYAKQVGERFDREEVLSLVAVAQAKVGDIDGARETVKELGTRDNNVHPFALVRPAFAEALVRVEVDSARRRALSLKDVFQRNFILCGVVVAQLSNKDVAGAKQTAELIGLGHSLRPVVKLSAV
jgi:hypothetical protein